MSGTHSKSTGKPAHLILGAAAGYTPDKIRLFVQSLQAVGFRGRLVLFVYASQMADVPAMVHARAPSLDVEFVRIRGIREHSKFVRSCYKRLFSVVPAEQVPRLKRRMLRFQGMPHVTRYFHYEEYLARHPGFSHVLLSDVRDVVFQDDPFHGVGEGLHLGMETPSLTLATEPFDRDWLLDAYGPAMLDRIGDRQVSCSGVTLGDMASMTTYIRQILRETLDLPFRKMKTRIYDQAFHNKLLHCGELATAHLCQPLVSRIATLGCMKPEDFVLTGDGQLLNRDGNVAPIVHQYDRHPVLVDAFEARMPA
ncbi:MULTISPECIES: hypothetical protein [Dyella]|uniref:Uncharacterized protein n=2 Tax=Dyella TaxID=231454 RepID=A0A4V2NLC9_9GAMM|nr:MULTISPECIES: hypothetical protein [Dyella]TBR36504.1 hypothetical protein EYV96_11240 [Dyella terrae]TCI08404.1 hypothetical protein EZM97_27630 [Dyella soli]